jgi:putative aminopeptidase FrvX
MKVNQMANAKFWQVYVGVDSLGIFHTEAAALQRALEAVAAGEAAIVYTYTHESVQILP